MTNTKPELLISAFLLAVVLTGCEMDTTGLDQCQRQELFRQCMKLLPAGPEATKDNDWAEVASACDNVARDQSLKNITLIKVECRR